MKAMTSTEGSDKIKDEFLKYIELYMSMAATKPNSWWKDIAIVMYGVVVLIFCSVTGWTLFFLKYDDLSINTDALLYGVLFSHCLYVYSIYLKNRFILSNLIETMQDRFSPLSNQLNLQQYNYVWDNADRISFIVTRFANYFVAAMYIPYIYNAGIFSSQRKLLYPSWIPYSVETDLYYYLTVLMQVSALVYNHLVHLPGLGVCLGGAHFIGASFDVLGLAFSDICDFKETPDCVANSRNQDSIFFLKQTVAERKLKWIVETHVEITRFVKFYKTVFETTLIEVVLTYIFVICFAAFQAVLAAERQDYQKMGQNIFLIAVIVFHLFTFCYPGQHIYNKSEQFRNSLYCSHWEDQSVSFQKSMIIMMTATIRPITISFRGIVTSSMTSFQHTLRTAFSYVNILMVLKNH